ncbi:Na+/H+ antiporter [Flavihumibacter petaseus]|uniref:Putative CPA1 family transporter n=1 Tax=Flavihumibacter petaseus NBRC 106054 TaxID=1220578 RepID=A0A0E9MUK7_9BACT|nr:Na+/H+ antiporter [Flavihumibacter petaseus]GAO41422.1 putative CPA1 family transporter [Flavihumibacter petaseus NBRC 106054]
MQEQILLYIALIIAVLFIVMLAEKLRTAYPIVLVVAGLLLSLLPIVPEVVINPELIFVIFLPPLLYEAAWYTSWKELWRWRRVVGSFAFLIVLVTSLVVAWVSSSLIPGFSLALGFLLGGIVSPPDAVSATTVLKYVKVPKRFIAIVEGESLLNDAASLIVFRFALIAVETGRFVFHEAALSFVLVIVMGSLIGVAIAMVYYAIHRWLPTTPNIDIVLTLTAPYVMYIVAEHFHFSGVLAVVSGGLFLSYRSHLILSHRSRIRGANVWSMLGFVLNGLVFMLIGLELPVIIKELGDVSLGTAIGYGVLITGVLIVGRLLSTMGASLFTVFISRWITTADSRPGWRGPILLGWAGMRGVVSLAAALSIPYHIPQRNLILFITFTVILLTLVVQGLTLPLVVRLVNLDDPDHMDTPEQQDANIRRQLAQRTLHLLENNYHENVALSPALLQLREKMRAETNGTDGETRHAYEDFREVYLKLLDEQRDLLHDLNHQQLVDEEIVRKHLGLLDLEEEKVRMRYE